MTKNSNDDRHLESPTRAIEWRLRAVWLVAGLSLVAFAWYGSLVPLNYTPHSLPEAWTRFTTTPIDLVNPSMVDWGINALILVPAGFCLLGAATGTRSGILRRLVSTLVVAVGCLAVSFLIEFSQTWFPPRVPSPADVIAQFLGAAAGIASWWLCGKPFNRALADFLADKRTDSALDLALLAYVAGFLLFSVAPLDLTLHPAEIVQKFRDGRVLLVPFSHRSADGLLLDIVTDILLFVPVGVFAATFPTRRDGTIRPWKRSLVLGGLIVSGIETMQLLVMSRFTDTTDLITGMAGIALGVWGYRRFSRRPVDASTPTAPVRWRLVLVAVTYVVFVLAILWQPYNFSIADTTAIRQRMSLFVGVPLSGALQGDYFSALNGFLQKLLLFAPLGAWIVIFTANFQPAVRFVANAVLFCLVAVLALVIELGQILLPSRFASFDDVLICCTGALIGMWATNRLRSGRRATGNGTKTNSANDSRTASKKFVDRAL